VAQRLQTSVCATQGIAFGQDELPETLAMLAMMPVMRMVLRCWLGRTSRQFSGDFLGLQKLLIVGVWDLGIRHGKEGRKAEVGCLICEDNSLEFLCLNKDIQPLYRLMAPKNDCMRRPGPH